MSSVTKVLKYLVPFEMSRDGKYLVELRNYTRVILKPLT